MSSAAPSDETVVLALNSGSSSLKVALYLLQGKSEERLAQGAAEGLGNKDGRVWLRKRKQSLFDESRSFADASQAAEYLLSALDKEALPAPNVVGHRIVHGGPQLRSHQRITPEVLRELEEAVPFAPLHLPPALDVVRHALKRFPDVPQIACFDTVFHHTLPEYAARLPLPQEFWEHGLRRYGFHGLSCESIVHALGDQLASRTVIAHLGNGCSVTAVRDGASVETTMGLTPTGGVIMGTRSGDLDPGVILHLARVEGYSPEQVDELVNHDAGLLGISGESSDMRRLLEMANENPRASLAVEMFCYQVRKAIGALATVLGGLELLVFTGGIGEHAAAVRSRICSGLEYLGIVLDEAANQENRSTISSAKSRCRVAVIESDEDLQIARHCRRLIG
jgi:acetate kinase